jgi:adenylate kinase
LYQRNDDTEETVRNRIQIYLEQTQPLIEYYQQRGLLCEVDGSGPIEEVTRQVLAAVCVDE